MSRTFTTLQFPMYTFFYVLHRLRVLTKLGYGDDERMRDAVHPVLSKRRLTAGGFLKAIGSTNQPSPLDGSR